MILIQSILFRNFHIKITKNNKPCFYTNTMTIKVKFMFSSKWVTVICVFFQINNIRRMNNLNSLKKILKAVNQK